MGLFGMNATRSGAPDSIEGVIGELADQGQLSLTHRKDRRYLRDQVRTIWVGLTREERLYYAWLHARLARTLLQFPLEPEASFQWVRAKDMTRVVFTLWGRVYGEELGDPLERWPALDEDEYEILRSGSPLPAPAGMSAPAP